MAAKKKDSNLSLLIFLFLLLMIPLTVWAFNTFKEPTSEAKGPKAGQTGNGAPSGPHYNLNIIGVDKDKTADMNDNSGRRIFVPLQGKAKINLSEGEDFQVLDANATQGPAEFQLPNPDPDNDGITVYSVWARPLGKPGGKSTTTTCALDEFDVEWCSTEAMVQVRESGKSSFSDVSKQLLYIYVDLDGNGQLERYPIFDEALQDYFWNYDNNGLRLLQLRFYEVVSDVN